MKKILPFIILGIGIVVVVVAVMISKGEKREPVVEETAPEIPQELRPMTSLTPASDGHWLTMDIYDIKVSAASLDYELLYSLPDGRTQGVPGTVKIEKGVLIERKLLLGSESSGKFRYDEGVTKGTLTLKFRDDKGKLVGKLSTDFHLQSASSDLTSVDGQFKYTLDTLPKNTFFVVMNTFGVKIPLPGPISKGPYGIFASTKSALKGAVALEGDVYGLSGDKWVKLSSGKADNIGIFASIASQ